MFKSLSLGVMIGWFSGIRTRIVWIVGGVALVHAVVIAVILSFRGTSIPTFEIQSVDIVFAESVPDPIEPDPVEIVEESQSASALQTEAEQVFEPAAPPPPAISADIAVSPPVLMQDEAAATDTLLAESVADASIAAEPGLIAEEALASIVQTLNCQRLTHHRDTTCPKLDPFDVAAASQARREAAPESPHLVGNFGPKSYLEGFTSQKDREPFLMPGMSADLFTPAQPQGAYNAERIRNGKAPLWDKEIEAGFRRED